MSIFYEVNKMELIMLCGGEAKRMRPTTEVIPKALIKVRGRTLLDRQIEYVKNQGVVDKIILATGHLGELIQDEARRLSGKYNIEISFSHEDEPLGTGGATKHALKHVKNHDFLVMNVDDLHYASFNELIKFKEPTIALRHYRTNFGIVKTSGNSVVYFDEKPILPDVWVSLGVYYLNKDVELPDKGSLEKDVFPNIALKAYKYKGYFAPINNEKELEEAESQSWIK